MIDAMDIEPRLWAVTFIGPFLLPGTFSFVVPSTSLWLLLLVVFIGTVVILNIALRKLHFTKMLQQLIATTRNR